MFKYSRLCLNARMTGAMSSWVTFRAVFPLFLLLLSPNLVSACAEKGVYVESCFSEEVTSGRAGWGTCDFEGYLVHSTGTTLMMENYKPENARACALDGCLLVGVADDNLTVENWEECVPSKVVGTARFQFLSDGVPYLDEINWAREGSVVACGFSHGFHLEPQAE